MADLQGFLGLVGLGTASWVGLGGVRFAGLGTWFGTPMLAADDFTGTGIRPRNGADKPALSKQADDGIFFD